MSVNDEIRARVNLVDVIQSYNVTLHKAGHNYKALCPFHTERTPSFMVWPDEGRWRCFGSCGEGGDVFNFVMKHENVDFNTARTMLAQRAGIEIEVRTPEQADRDAQLDRLRGLLKETAAFFHEQLLKAPGAADARAYVKKRGLKRETLDRFMIGFAPGGWRHALDYLTTLGYSEADVLTAGVASRSDEGRIYERFRNRLIIPICDARGKVIGFGARALDPDDNPKYLNSPQTALFDKGRNLFALDSARRTIREGETAVIVEGYMDALQAHQAGYTNVVAQMGTALTPPQLDLLTRYARKLVLALDPDAAGAVATLRELNLARRQLGSYKASFDPHTGRLHQMSHLRDVDLRVLTLPDGQDPDDLIRDTPGRWPELVAAAQPLTDYVIAMRTAHVTPKTSLADREQIARDLLPDLLESELDRQRSVQELALRLRINERDLMAFAQRQRRESTHTEPFTAKQQRAFANRVDEQHSIKPKADPRASINAPATPQANRDPGLDMEGYCLAALIQQPLWWSVANRHLMQLAPALDLAAIPNHDQDAAHSHWLGPLSAEDFTRPDCRALLDWLGPAVEQDELTPLEYLRRSMPGELNTELERLLAGPLASISRPGTWEARELESIRAARLNAGYEDEAAVAEVEFVEKALELRRRRLRREHNELYFAQCDGYDSPALRQQLSHCRQALAVIDGAIDQAKRDRSRLTI